MTNNGDVLTRSLNLGLAKGNDEVVGEGLLGNLKALTVGDLVLEEDGNVGVTDGGLEQTTVVLSGVRRNNLETGIWAYQLVKS